MFGVILKWMNSEVQRSNLIWEMASGENTGILTEMTDCINICSNNNVPNTTFWTQAPFPIQNSPKAYPPRLPAAYYIMKHLCLNSSGWISHMLGHLLPGVFFLSVWNAICNIVLPYSTSLEISCSTLHYKNLSLLHQVPYLLPFYTAEYNSCK